MLSLRSSALLVAIMAAALHLVFAEVVAEAAPTPSRRVLVCGPRTAIVEISPDHPEGKVEWSHPGNTREGWVLPNGNVLLALSRGDGGPGGAAVEIERGKDGAAERVVWRYDGTNMPKIEYMTADTTVI